MSRLKADIYEQCLKFVNQRIATAETALAQAREASNDDTKSSAGDKYETSREMAQQDIDRNKRLLMDAQENFALLKSIEPLTDQGAERVRAGNLVYTDQGVFYLSISAGQLSAGDLKLFAVSAASPIGRMMLGKQQRDVFTFNDKSYTILEIS